MGFFITQRRTGLFSAKGGGLPAFKRNLPPDVLLEDLGNKDADSLWIEVQTFQGGAKGQSGWVEPANILEVESKKVPRARLSLDETDERDLGIFVAECVSRAWTANLLKDMAPFYADADYLIALALVQSGLTNPAGLGPNEERVGPFGITKDEWKAFTEAAFDPSYQYKENELQLPLFQVAAATWQMHTDARALSAKWQEKGVGTAEDPYLPRFAELLRCRLMGVDLTFAMQGKLKDDLGSQMLDAFLKEAGVKDADAKALMTDRCRFMRSEGKEDGDPVSLQVFDHKCAEELNTALQKAFELISKFVPEAVTRVDADGDAPWVEFAAKEMKDGVNESTDAGRKRIHEYFQSTGFTQGTADDKWCAAFVAWCMDQCGSPISKSFDAFRAKAAGSANWRNWGNVAISLKEKPPIGAVVVLSPSKNTDAISHVGFFKEYLDDTREVVILGGNQSNSVCERPFSATDVIEIRWLQRDVGGGGKKVAGSVVADANEGDLLTLARTIFGEARNSSKAAMQDVASVILNRVAAHFRGKMTISEVCLDPRQFSCWNMDDKNRAKMLALNPQSTTENFQTCLAVARDAIKGAFPDLTGGALHYFAKSMNTPPPWVAASPNARLTHTDDAHFFYAGIR